MSKRVAYIPHLRFAPNGRYVATYDVAVCAECFREPCECASTEQGLKS